MQIFCRLRKHKFFVVASLDPRLRFFIINSRVPLFMAGKPALTQMQLPLHASNYRFLKHDSFLSCHELLGGSDALEVGQLLSSDPSTLKGTLEPRARVRVKRAIGSSETLAQGEIDLLLKQWPE